MSLVSQALKNRTILIAGATSMVGWQIACRCAQSGATVIALSRDNGPLKKLQAELLRISGHHHFIEQFDIAQVEKIQFLTHNILSCYGEIDGFVHAPGICPCNDFANIHVKDFERIFRINYLSLSELAKNLFLRENSKLSVAIHVSTISPLDNASGLMPYAVCFGAAVFGMYEFAKEIKRSDIYIHCLSPSPCSDPLQRSGNTDRLNLLAEATVKLLSRNVDCPSGELVEVDENSTLSLLKHQKIRIT